MRKTLKNRYYKDQDPSRPLMSGLPLPKSSDGKVHDIDFVDCTFHPNCRPDMFLDCTFTNCDGPTDYSNQIPLFGGKE